MPQPLKVLEISPSALPSPARKRQVRLGVWIELIAGGILSWRLLVEQRGGFLERIGQAERRASWVTAMSLFALAVYIVADSAFAFITKTQPEASWWGGRPGCCRGHHYASFMARQTPRRQTYWQHRSKSRCRVQRHLCVHVSRSSRWPAPQSAVWLVVGRSLSGPVHRLFPASTGT